MLDRLRRRVLLMTRRSMPPAVRDAFAAEPAASRTGVVVHGLLVQPVVTVFCPRRAALRLL